MNRLTTTPLLPALFLLLSLSLTNCQNSNAPGSSAQTGTTRTGARQPAYENIDLSTFRSKMQEDNIVILDVRTPGETRRGMIPGAQAIDFQQPDFREQISRLDKDKTYLVYCQSGMRSARACEMMAEMGFDSLFNLPEGYRAWPGN